eukprot:Amastigsp_a850756_5.p3 type:complete len:211 gc:universal Amastigsp_a850756_5:323-955(+)
MRFISGYDATRASDEAPRPIEYALNWLSTASPAARCPARKTKACLGTSWPDARGRSRVRATRASMSRSQRSLTMQPAPRIATAPIPQSAMYLSSRAPMPWAFSAPAMPMDHTHGQYRSHVPMGRSRRASLRYGRHDAGARVSTHVSTGGSSEFEGAAGSRDVESESELGRELTRTRSSAEVKARAAAGCVRPTSESIGCGTRCSGCDCLS